MKKLFKTLLVLVILGVVGYFGYQYYAENHGVASQIVDEVQYTQYTIATGNLSKTVTGTGTLSISQTEELSLDYAVTIDETLVEAGEVVAQGQALLSIDTDALQTTIDTLQTELDTCETSMASLASSFSSTATLKMPQYGRIKELYISQGQYIQDVMDEVGSIALLSLDNLMYTEVDAAEGMAISTEVKVKIGRNTIDGVVRSIEGGKANITFSDGYSSEGGEVEVVYKSESLGTSIAHISMPYYLTTTEKGYIDAVYAEVNDRKWENNRVAYLINIPVSQEYTTLQSTREKFTTQIKALNALKSEGVLNAPAAGIVASIVSASQSEQTAYTALATLYVGDDKNMVVSVDELDIINVAVGQNVDIAMDAITDKTYSASVSKVSQIGTATSGVTVYNVTLTIAGDDQLKLGMNGTATINIEEVTDVLLVPITAMNTSRNGSYVWVLDPTAEVSTETAAEPGIQTFIETGLSDENYAEVTSGLNAGDIVLITREASSTSTSSESGFDMSMMMNMDGGSMPSMGSGSMPSMGSGSMPSGGTAPSGGGTGGGTGGGGGRQGGN
ncbi:MAG: HlyD family efflux transporter periplasmic adaptor subunit [Clostridiales bacterium]|nr:HlyD family efflux transporter periplasmic adaptor subunit [Clostridiales bacterium]